MARKHQVLLMYSGIAAATICQSFVSSSIAEGSEHVAYSLGTNETSIEQSK